MKSRLLFLSLVIFLSSAISAIAGLKSHQSADIVLGQPDFETSAGNLSQTGFQSVGDVAVDPTTGKVFVSDTSNSRVLRFASSASLSSGDPAEAVLGQMDFITDDATSLADNRFSNPAGIYVDPAGRLWVADRINHRVLRFDNASSKTNGAAADGVLGQIDFDSSNTSSAANGMLSPIAVTGDASGTLWVADRDNNRVLRFDNAAGKADGAIANGVLGQSMTTGGTGGLAVNKMSSPSALAVDADGTLWVADAINNRVLRFDNAAGRADGANADGVLGQADFDSGDPGLDDSGFNYMEGIDVDSTGFLYVSDIGNHRILGFSNASTKADGAAAELVLGQPDFETNAVNVTASGLTSPRGIGLDAQGRLYVADGSAARVLRFSPSGKPILRTKTRITTRRSTVTLRGTAASELGIARVQVKAGRGGFKNARGTTRWKFRVRRLTSRVTRANVRATAVDNTRTQKVVRIRRK